VSMATRVLLLSCAVLATACERAAPEQGKLAATLELASESAGPAATRRPGELINPDESTMVLLYHDLAQLTPPFAQWRDDDLRVRMATPAEKPAARDLVQRELEAGFRGVHDVGRIRLSLSANLSDYDMTYGEYTVRALAPSSVILFQAFGQKATLKFGNARSAQVWRVPQAEAQRVRDRIGFPSDVSIDVTLAIRDVHAAPEGGTITADVIEYELRENRGGSLLGRVQLAP